MRAPLRVRLACACLTAIALAVTAWTISASYDLDRTWRQLQDGREITWPPERKHADAGGPGGGMLGAAAGAMFPLALAGIVPGFTLLAFRWRRRRVRAAAMETYELQLGRDDLASPYQVQEAFEGVVGAISARWYRRLWQGQDHFALEIHRLPSEQIAFTIAAPTGAVRSIRGPLEDLYPDVVLRRVEGRPEWTDCIVRLKKRRPFVLSLQTVRVYDHAFGESLVNALDAHGAITTVQLVLTPASSATYRRARRMLKRRERALQSADRRDPVELGIDSVVEAKELKGALETQHRSLLQFELRVCGHEPKAVRATAGMFAQLRSENELAAREMLMRRRVYARRIWAAMPNPLPSLRTGVLSTSELSMMWQLPRARTKNARLARSTVRRALAPGEIERDHAQILLRDERGAVSMAAEDRKYGHALIGGQGGGKSSVMARHFANDTRDFERAVILIDPKGPLAELCLGLAPLGRTVHYLDLGRPEMGINPLSIDASPGTRAAVFVQALTEANPPGAIQAASDSFLRQAVSAVCTVEHTPTLWHVYRMLDFGASQYRSKVVAQLDQATGAEFAKRYWQREFPALIRDRGYAAQALNPPRNKIERLISTREIDMVLRHPVPLDLEAIVERGEVLIVAGAKSAVGEDNTILIAHVLLQLVHRAIQSQQDLPEDRRRRVSVLIDEAHNVLTPSVAKMLAEGRSAGLEAVFAWQYSAQIRDEVIRSGVRSLLQSISIFRMREMEDARSLAGLAMEVYSDRISVDQDEQERLRFSPDDILRLPVHQAINLWIADGVPRPGFVGCTLQMESLADADLERHHRVAQRARGAHYPEKLPDLYADDDSEARRGRSAKRSVGVEDGRPTAAEDANGQQRFSDRVEGFEGDHG